jgi:immune inhibitor A
VGLLGATLATGGIALGPTAFAGSAANGPAAAPSAHEATPSDNLPNPLDLKRSELREEAISGVLTGRFTSQQRNGSTVVKVGETADATGNRALHRAFPRKKSHYVELERETTDRIFVILAEFGNDRHPSYPDQDTDPATPGPARFDGPLVNEIPEPDRTVDNATVWQADYSQEHFQDLYFSDDPESLRGYYETQSSGRYSVGGTVTDWVRVQFNQARYGRSNGFPCTSIVCSNTWQLVRDAANQWHDDQIAQGKTPAEVAAEMASFDVWDRYDYNGNGNFNEPDGYIDHFQIVHAGGDQADGDPIYGEDAIWSHRWYAFQDFGIGGPDFNKLGGTQIGTSGIWIGDYTIQPENGGRSVFYHEFAHDLGLPDDYNVLSGGDNNNEHWTLMAQSRLGAKNDGGIGERGGDLGAWNKLQLGWLDFAMVDAGQTKLLTLGPQEFNTKNPQAVVVVLPPKELTFDLGAPFAGEHQWYSGDGHNMNNTLTREVTLGAGAAQLSFQARWDIEDCGPDPCDYAFVEVNDGGGWDTIPGSITVPTEGNGIDGTVADWTPATFDLSAYAGSTIGLRFRYQTDPAAAGNDPTLPNGIFFDDIAITSGGSTIFSDGAEAGDNGWTLAGFANVGATVSQEFDHFYIAGHRSYTSFDKYLKTGPYYFGYLNTKPDFVDHYAYQTGLLISYWDRSQSNNDTFAHPGEGRNLYIDSHPEPMFRQPGVPWRARVQVYDAPFGLRRTDKVTLHHNSVPFTITSKSGRPVFDDTKKYWFEELPNHGVKLPAAGVKIRVLLTYGDKMLVLVS